jgi:hypothetical protein
MHQRIERNTRGTGGTGSGAARRAWVLGALVAGSLAACSSSASNREVAVVVGGTTISRGAVGHWSGVHAAEAREAGRPSRQLALRTLVASAWIVGEAAARGFAISTAEVERRIAERAGTSGDQHALSEIAAWSGRSLSDLKAETKTELAAQKLRLYVRRRERASSRVAASQVVSYWMHGSQFRHRERRTLNFVESLPTVAAGLRLRRAIRSGRRSISSVAIRETREPWGDEHERGAKNGVIHAAIFRSPLHVLEGPLPWNGVYALYEVVRVSPPGRWPLARFRASIEQQLASAARTRARAGFVAAWRERWRALTSCRPGFVISLCRQYRGRVGGAPEPFALPSG